MDERKLFLAVTLLMLSRSLYGKPGLQVPVVSQEAGQWCWAAATEMVLKFNGVTDPNLEQCKQAQNALHPLSDCCVEVCSGGEVPIQCDQPGWPDFKFFKFNVSCREGPLNWKDLLGEIKDGRPVVGTWLSKKDYSAHIMVIKNADYSAGLKRVTIIDPKPTCTGHERDPESYESYRQIGIYRQWYNFYNIRSGTGEVSGDCPPQVRRVEELAALFQSREGQSQADVDPDYGVENTFKSAEDAAIGGWRRILEAAGRKNKDEDDAWGLVNSELTDKAVMGAPLDEYFIDYSSLKVHQGVDPMLSAEPTGVRLFPLNVNGKPMAGITVFKDGDVWRFGSFSAGALGERGAEASGVVQLFRQRAIWMSDVKRDFSDFMKINATKLDGYFLGLKNGVHLDFIPVLADPYLKMQPGVKESGDKLLERTLTLGKS